jgi:hypothetical protein
MKIILVSLSLLIALTGYTQSAEFIILHKGDTVRGSVHIYNKEVKVIRQAGDTAVFNSEDVWQYVKNGSKKTVLKCILYGYSDNIEEIQSPNYVDPVYDTTLLLRPVITEERLNLFSVKDKRGVVYFFIQGIRDSVPVQLLYAVGGQIPDKSTWGQRYQLVSVISHFRIFESQLREATLDCDNMREGDFEMLNYLESSLKKFIRRFNKMCR